MRENKIHKRKKSKRMKIQVEEREEGRVRK